MTASLETLVIAAYVFADSLRIPRPGPVGEITDKELIALGVAQAATGINSDRQFLGVVARLLPGWFAHLPDQSQFNRRLRRLTPYMATVQLQVAELIAEGRVRLADGSLIACANYPGCASHSHFAGHRCYGYCAAKSEYVWGCSWCSSATPGRARRRKEAGQQLAHHAEKLGGPSRARSRAAGPPARPALRR
jgi:hypothetical protein